MNRTQDTTRKPELDGVRGIAILLVLVWHYIACQVIVEPQTTLYYLTRILSLTWSGVDLFFVLSGFLIAGQLLDHRHAPNYFRIFYFRRACRIFPLYFLLLALFVLLTSLDVFLSPSFRWLFQEPLPLWSYATFTQNIFMGLRGDFGPHWLGITWSLAVEEQFYLLVPLMIYFLPRRVLLLALIMGLLAAPILRYAYPGFHAITGAPWRADSLLAGATLAILVRDERFASMVREQRALLFFCFFALLAAAAILTFFGKIGGALDHLLLAAFYFTFILIAYLDCQPLVGALLRCSVLTWFGQLSYGIYMIHQAVSGLLHGIYRNGPPTIANLSDAGVTVLSLFVTLLLAAWSYRFIEAPVLRWGHKFHYAVGDPIKGMRFRQVHPH